MLHFFKVYSYCDHPQRPLLDIQNMTDLSCRHSRTQWASDCSLNTDRFKILSRYLLLHYQSPAYAIICIPCYLNESGRAGRLIYHPYQLRCNRSKWCIYVHYLVCAYMWASYRWSSLLVCVFIYRGEWGYTSADDGVAHEFHIVVILHLQTHFDSSIQDGQQGSGNALLHRLISWGTATQGCNIILRTA